MALRPSLRTLPLLVLALAIVTGCADIQGRGERLQEELESAYPDQIRGISFEYNFLDPPLLLIDVNPGMTPAAERQFLCDEIAPRVAAAGGDIDVTTSYGWYMTEECLAIVVVDALGTTYELPFDGWIIPVAFALLVGVLLIYRRRYPGLTPILIAVVTIPVFLIVLGLLSGSLVTSGD